MTKKLLHLLSSIFILAILLSGCSATKYLKPKESLLFSQTVVGNKISKTEELEAFFRQKINRRFLKLPINPYIPIYFEGKKRYDKKKQIDIQNLNKLEEKYDILLNNENLTVEERQALIAEREKKTTAIRKRIREGNWLMRAVGEKPILFDSVLMHKTASQMQLFLHQKGFFAAKVIPSYQNIKQRCKVTYQVIENTPTTIHNISYKIKDSTIAKLLLKDTLNRLFQTKKRYEESKLDAERIRITRKLKDEGYFDFSKQFIFFEVDSINPPENTLDIRLFIENPDNNTQHKQWEVSEVIMTTDVNVVSNKVARENKLYDNILFRAYTHKYSNKILSRKIHLQPNQIYSQTATENTQRSLALLEMFKFVNIKYDTVQNKLRANIYASPATKYSFTLEGGAEINLNQNIPGPFGSFSFRNLNTFGSCEVLTFKVQASLEAQGAITNTGTSYQSKVFNANISLAFPRVIFPLPKNFREKIEIYNPTSKFQTGFHYINRPEFIRNNYQANFGYAWISHQQRFFTINISDLNIVKTPFISGDFEKFLDDQSKSGNNFKYSFTSAFISSISFSYTYNTFSPAKKVSSQYFRLFLESGGTTLNLLSTNFLRDNPYIFGDLRYYRFLKSQTDFRYYIPSGRAGMLAMRFNLGLATPYGITPQGFEGILPYEKYFFGGGSNSIRGWQPLRLGVGGFIEPDVSKKDGTPSYAQIRYGEMLLEMSIELRQKLFGFVHGAAFIDAGNTWMLSAEPFPNSRFAFDKFYNQIAVGGGLGLRFDFSFLILRFDVGTKLVEPGEYDVATLQSHNLPDNLRKKPLFDRSFLERTSLYFGIGYPF
jgi:outer membrane protein insertion porin family